MSSLGQELKHAREKASFSAEQIAQQTKITLRLIKALEDERFDLMPEPFFIKGVLKAYVRAIGADEAYFLDLYQSGLAPTVSEAREPPASAPPQVRERSARPSPPPPARVHRPEFQDFREARDRSGRGRKHGVRLRPWVLAVLLVFFLAIVAALVFFYVQSRPKPLPPLPAAAKVAQPIAKPEVPASEPAPTNGQAQPAFEAGLKLSLRFTADTWIQVAADGKIVLEGIQAAGRETTLNAAEEFILQIGNAGGVTYALNGKPGLPFGAPGSVRTDIRINPRTAADFLKKPPGPAPAA